MFINKFKAVYPDPRYMSINFHMLLHLADQNLVTFGSGPSSWNFAYESRNKSMKAINTNGKPNLKRTLLQRHLIDTHLEDYVNTLPLHHATTANHLSFIRKKDSDNVSQMLDETQGEYLMSEDCFDLGQFMNKRRAFQVQGYEHLPPSAVKSLKLKKESSLPADDFAFLLKYYTVR